MFSARLRCRCKKIVTDCLLWRAFCLNLNRGRADHTALEVFQIDFSQAVVWLRS